jgi:hypothetical protein
MDNNQEKPSKLPKYTKDDYIGWAVVAMIVIGFFWLIFRPGSPDANSNPSIENPYTDSSSEESDQCTSDCSGHSAGYEWGSDNDICDTEYDNGNSESFNEGVREYAEDNC